MKCATCGVQLPVGFTTFGEIRTSLGNEMCLRCWLRWDGKIDWRSELVREYGEASREVHTFDAERARHQGMVVR